MDSDIPTQSVDNKSLLGNLHLAFVMDKAVVEEHAQWWQRGMRAKIDAQTRMDPGASFLVDGEKPALSAWIAEDPNRILGKELTESEARTFSDLAHEAKVRESEAWAHFWVFSLVQPGTQSRDLVDTRWALTWKEFEGEKTIKVRLVARGYQDPDLRMGNVDIAVCVSRRSSHLQVISLVALGQWPLWSLGIKNAFLQADGFGRDGYFRAPCV